MAEPTYIFKDGHVYTMVDGQVVASVKEADFGVENDPGFTEEQALAQSGGPEVEMPQAPADIAPMPCPSCGQPSSAGDSFCPSCGQPLQQPEDFNPDDDPYHGTGFTEGPVVSKQIVSTPNGLKGRVLARTPELWGEQVTVRWENGNITSIPVDQRLTFATAEEPSPSESLVERLEERLAAHFEQDKASLVERGRELQQIKREAGSHASKKISDGEAVELSKITSQANYELAEITATLDAINAGEQEAFEAPAPIESLPAVTQASTGGNDASWLDQVHTDMVAEANSTDYLKLMDEGPEQLVASLTPAQLADASVTRIIASRTIEAKAAGADEKQQDHYKKLWLARVEEQRKSTLAAHKEEVAEKTASDEPSHPDESLFL
jgi:hypothetical protein